MLGEARALGERERDVQPVSAAGCLLGEVGAFGEGAVQGDVQLARVAGDRTHSDEGPELGRQMRQLAPKARAVLAIDRRGVGRVGALPEKHRLDLRG